MKARFRNETVRWLRFAGTMNRIEIKGPKVEPTPQNQGARLSLILSGAFHAVAVPRRYE